MQRQNNKKVIPIRIMKITHIINNPQEIDLIHSQEENEKKFIEYI